MKMRGLTDGSLRKLALMDDDSVEAVLEECREKLETIVSFYIPGDEDRHFVSAVDSVVESVNRLYKLVL